MKEDKVYLLSLIVYWVNNFFDLIWELRIVIFIFEVNFKKFFIFNKYRWSNLKLNDRKWGILNKNFFFVKSEIILGDSIWKNKEFSPFFNTGVFILQNKEDSINKENLQNFLVFFAFFYHGSFKLASTIKYFDYFSSIELFLFFKFKVRNNSDKRFIQDIFHDIGNKIFLEIFSIIDSLHIVLKFSQKVFNFNLFCIFSRILFLL